MKKNDKKKNAEDFEIIHKAFEQNLKLYEMECGILRSLLILAHFDSTVKYNKDVNPCDFYYPRWILFNHLINQLENVNGYEFIQPDLTVFEFVQDVVNVTYNGLLQILDEQLNDNIDIPEDYDKSVDYDRINAFKPLDVELQVPSYYNTVQIKDILIRCCSDNHDIHAKFMMSAVPTNLKRVIFENELFKGSGRCVKLDRYLSFCHGIYTDETIIKRYNKFIDDYKMAYDKPFSTNFQKYNLFIELVNSGCEAIYELLKVGFTFPDFTDKLKVTNTQYMFNKPYDDSSIDAINYIYEEMVKSSQKTTEANPQYITNDIKYFFMTSSDTEKIFRLNFNMDDEIFASLIIHIYHVIGDKIALYQKDKDHIQDLINSILTDLNYFENIIFTGLERRTKLLEPFDRYVTQISNLFNYFENNIIAIICGEKPLIEKPEDEGLKLEQKPNKPDKRNQNNPDNK